MHSHMIANRMLCKITHCIILYPDIPLCVTMCPNKYITNIYIYMDYDRFDAPKSPIYHVLTMAAARI